MEDEASEWHSEKGPGTPWVYIYIHISVYIYMFLVIVFYICMCLSHDCPICQKHVHLHPHVLLPEKEFSVP